jgi:hypothetical protein
MARDLSSYISVEVVGRKKRPKRKPFAIYSKKWDKLLPGEIARVNIYNWISRTNTTPKQYIHRVYKGLYEVIEMDAKGFTIRCLAKRERW